MIHYEWDVITLDLNDCIIDHRHCSTLREALYVRSKLSGKTMIELVRDAWDGASRLTMRQWATYEDGHLPERFDYGAKVPKSFHDECKKMQEASIKHLTTS